jgi:hypothetical protein
MDGFPLTLPSPKKRWAMGPSLSRKGGGENQRTPKSPLPWWERVRVRGTAYV